MRFHIFTLGCKVNQYESQAMAQAFIDAGFTRSGEAAEVLIINSCAVTQAAERKTRKLLRRVRRENPSSVVVLTGCMPQAFKGGLKLPDADIIIGTKGKAALARLVLGYLEQTGTPSGRRPAMTCIEAFEGAEFEEMTVEHFDDSFQRAYIKVQDGCDRFCSYCIIPAARGPVRSRLPESIAKQAGVLVKNGYREIVLTGINLSSYGRDLGLGLFDALGACDISGDFRIRLGSLEPDLLDERIFGKLAQFEKLCPHFHLALQSGCDDTLGRMNRKYTTARFERLLELICSAVAHPAITTDLMVGFPGETKKEFEQTCRFVEKMEISRAHIFEFSPRPGTPAHKMPGQIPADEKRERAAILKDICAKLENKYAKSQLGATVRVLTEAGGGGYDDRYLYVQLNQAGALGEFVDAKITDVSGGRCRGKIITQKQ
jgi:threonylcarbamoyladenosine tRNA methylthiotransferase MtaB